MKTIKLEIPNERTLSMINHPGLANQSTSRSGHEPTNPQRRTLSAERRLLQKLLERKTT